jgi:hypothetical protein
MTILEGLKRILLGPEQQALPMLGRNDRCWCGSGRKYKACHLASDDRKKAAERAAATGPRKGGMF